MTWGVALNRYHNTALAFRLLGYCESQTSLDGLYSERWDIALLESAAIEPVVKVIKGREAYLRGALRQRDRSAGVTDARVVLGCLTVLGWTTEDLQISDE